MTSRIRVLLVDDHSVVRLGLRALLAADPAIEVVGEASDGREAIGLCEQLVPDVVVMDLMMREMDGLAATRELTRRWSNLRILALTMHAEEDYLIPLLQAGATGYIMKDAASADLLTAVRAVAAGQTFVRPAATPILAAGWSRRATEDQLRVSYESLSQRERDVFRLIAYGYSASQVAEQLCISAKTVDTYRRRINQKMEISERAEYVQLALELGLLLPAKQASDRGKADR